MNRLVQAARKYEGVKWRHRGRSIRGLDCGGLPWLAYRDCGVEMPDVAVYGRDPFNNGLMKMLTMALGAPVWEGEKGTCRAELLKPGMVVVMSPAGLPRHIAIVGDSDMYGLSLIHADGTPGVGRVWEHGLTEQFMRQIVCAFWRPIE